AESAGPRTHPDFEIESQQFQVQLRKAGFLNKDNRYIESLDGYNKLSEEMKSFSIIAQTQRINYIKEKLSSKKQLVTRSIPVTIDEA
ncbi:4596_t:CDS:1, partial [Funneliformis caledonium]